MKTNLIVCVLGYFFLGTYICQAVYRFCKDEDTLCVRQFWRTVLSFLGLCAISFLPVLFKCIKMLIFKVLS